MDGVDVCGAIIYDIRAEGVGGSAQRQTIVLTGCASGTVKRGRVTHETQLFADAICEQPQGNVWKCVENNKLCGRVSEKPFQYPNFVTGATVDRCQSGGDHPLISRQREEGVS